MTLSIIIVSYNARRHLENCLSSLFETPPMTPHDVTVVDNASTDGSANAVRAAWPHVQVIAQDRNTGFAAANNTGIRATHGDLIMLLNSDTIVPRGAVDALVQRLTADSQAAVAGPRLIDTAGVAELSFGEMISPFTELRQKALLALHGWRVPPVTNFVERITRREQYVDWLSAACLLVYRNDAEAVGLLDERYFLYMEDVDFCASIRALGRRILFTPSAEITHVRGRSRAAAPDAARAAYRRSHLAFYEKHHPSWLQLLRAYLWLKGELPDT
jgi:GT2 family glycosyltransferase